MNKDFSLMLKDLNELNFDMAALNIGQQPSLYDPFQNWHSSNTKAGGSNRCGFATPETDRLIEMIRKQHHRRATQSSLSSISGNFIRKRSPRFLFSPKERIIASKRILLELSIRRPGYLENLVKER